MNRTRIYLGALLRPVLTACGGGGGDSDHHENVSIDTAGRLAVAENAGVGLAWMEIKR